MPLEITGDTVGKSLWVGGSHSCHSHVGEDPEHLCSRRGSSGIDSWDAAREGSSQQKEVSIPPGGPVIQGRAELSPGITGLYPPNSPLLKIKIRTSKDPLGCGRIMDKKVDTRRLFVGIRRMEKDPVCVDLTPHHPP